MLILIMKDNLILIPDIAYSGVFHFNGFYHFLLKYYKKIYIVIIENWSKNKSYADYIFRNEDRIEISYQNSVINKDAEYNE